MTETEPDTRLVKQIPALELIEILGEKLKEHPLILSATEEQKEKVAEFMQKPQSEETLPIPFIRLIIDEIMRRKMDTDPTTGIEDPEADPDELLRWESALFQICHGLALVGTTNLLILMDIASEIKSANEEIKLMDLTQIMMREKSKKRLKMPSS